MNSLLIFNFLWIKNNIGSTAAVYIPRGPYLCGSSTDTSSKRRRRSTQSHSQVAVCSFFSRVVQIRWNVDQEEHNGGANDEEALEYSNDSLEGPLATNPTDVGAAAAFWLRISSSSQRSSFIFSWSTLLLLQQLHTFLPKIFHHEGRDGHIRDIYFIHHLLG